MTTVYQNKKTKETYCCFGEIPAGTKKVWLYSQTDDSGHGDVLENVSDLDTKYEIIDSYEED